MICCVPDVKETYANMKILFDLTNLNLIPFKFVSDLKLTLTVNGLQTAVSSYPSPFCFVTLKSMREYNGEDEFIDEDVSEADDIVLNERGC